MNNENRGHIDFSQTHPPTTNHVTGSKNVPRVKAMGMN